MNSWPDILPRVTNQRLKKVKSNSTWFEIYTLNDDTYAIIEPYHYEEAISYLIIGQKNAILFDTGMGIADIRKEVELLTEQPVTVVNSHCHHDHIGGNSDFTDIWVFDDDWEVSRVEDGKSEENCKKYMDSSLYIKLPSDFDKDRYFINSSKVTKRLKDQDRIEIGNRELLVHHTPGHTPESICLQDMKYGLLFTGDTFYKGEIYVNLEGSDFNNFLKSFRYLKDLYEKINHLCPGHNEVFISKEFLIKALEAFELIESGKKDFKIVDGNKIYQFNGFSISL